MKDPRLRTLAENLLQVSTSTKAGDIVLIRGGHESKPLMLELISLAHEIGAIPHAEIGDEDISRAIMKSAKDAYLDFVYDTQKARYEKADVIISIDATHNDYATSDVPDDIKTAFSRKLQPLSKIVLNKKWVVLMYPTAAKAQKAQMSTEAFYDYVIDVSTVDYRKMRRAMEPLKKRMENADKVEIKGPGTDLSFSIKDIPVVPCAGENNIPDGEVFTAPVKESVNGTITFNTPSPQRGRVYKNVSLTFEDGRITDASHEGDKAAIDAVLDTDEGARYVGEFAIGLNPRIEHPMGSILFDEKIKGSLHFTPGRAYDDAWNGNDSAVHWDLVLIQTEAYGGGEIYFDGELIRKDGMFVPEDLRPLNPEALDT